MSSDSTEWDDNPASQNGKESTMTYSPDTQRARDLLSYLVSEPDATIEDYRRLYDEVCSNFELPADAEVEDVDAGGTPAIWVSAPGVDPDTVIIVVHGGGFTMGNAKGYRELGYRLSKAANARALVVDYRLAPEAPFPLPVEDVASAYRFARGQDGVRNVVLVGDSAGGGLVFSTLLMLRDAQERLPDAAVAMSPLVDLAGEGASLTERAHLDPLPAAALVSGLGGTYLNGADPMHPLASPVYADLAGLPPTLVLVGTDEGLYDDATRIVEKLKEDGVEVRFEVGENLPHIWPIFSFHPEAVATTDRIGAFIREQISAKL
ncbi:alpha/beta hydrolase [Rhodococcus sp. HM1]|uniref:alpha/beta hydrolase n=1 Tax=Rhodococcus sp. HM1 TaxID=2937759 RepID=UPI00200B76B2|nr:alpha/beta hydrolase [Rhodococcus sp. HM1]MCK8671592.1 alpha/beta hydrolase [Rhodococcus sp. HM1]